MRNADRIREYAREKYLLPARSRGVRSFSIRVGDVVRDLSISGRAPAVCSALRTHRFLEENDLRLVETSGPESGQSTTVTYTYEFADTKPSASQPENPWARLRGVLKDVFAEFGGGEAYLRDERKNFYGPPESK